MPKPGRMMGGHGSFRPKNTKKTIARIAKMLLPYKWLLLLVAACIAVSSVANIYGSRFIMTAIDDYIASNIGKPNVDFIPFIKALAMMGSVYLVGVIASFVYQRLMLTVTAGTLHKVRSDLFSHLEKLPIRYYDKHTHGELMSRFTNDTDALREMLSNGIPQLLSSTITVIGAVVMMLVYSWLLTLVVFAVLIIMVLFVKNIGKVSGKYFMKQQESLAKVNGYIEELIEGQKVVKVFTYEDTVKSRFAAIVEELRKHSTTANTCANVLMPIMGNLGHILYVVLAIVGSLLVINQGMVISISVGILVMFLQLTRTVSQPIGQISQQFNSILLALAGAERIFMIMDEPAEVDDGYVTLVNAKIDEDGNITETEEKTGFWAWKHPHKAEGTVTYTQVKGDVRFVDVVFGYEENKTVLDGITLYAKPGQKVAFVGSTGAGKTTITNLINRFYDVPDGKIRYDGININKIKKDDLRRSLGMVLQDTNLFTGTVLDNIRYGKMDATDEECIAAAKLANADSFITRLPEGYNTMVTANGANLSQGQRQLLNIARATVSDPPVLILDEATSSIDTRTEKLIEQGMNKLMEGRTVFVIAHRLSTVRNADAIMVLEHGKIIERGDHDDLLAQKGKYYQLYTGMFELD